METTNNFLLIFDYYIKERSILINQLLENNIRLNLIPKQFYNRYTNTTKLFALKKTQHSITKLSILSSRTTKNTG